MCIAIAYPTFELSPRFDMLSARCRDPVSCKVYKSYCKPSLGGHALYSLRSREPRGFVLATIPDDCRLFPADSSMLLVRICSIVVHYIFLLFWSLLFVYYPVLSPDVLGLPHYHRCLVWASKVGSTPKGSGSIGGWIWPWQRDRPNLQRVDHLKACCLARYQRIDDCKTAYVDIQWFCSVGVCKKRWNAPKNCKVHVKMLGSFKWGTTRPWVSILKMSIYL